MFHNIVAKLIDGFFEKMKAMHKPEITKTKAMLFVFLNNVALMCILNFE
jgi:hypothetical protein